MNDGLNAGIESIRREVLASMAALRNPQAAGGARTKDALRTATRAAIIAFTKDLRWTLSIPGDHYSGISNQALLDVRIREGRDFAPTEEYPDAGNTIQLKQWLRAELLERFESFSAVPTLQMLQDIGGKLIVKRVAERVMHGGLDIHEQPLSAAYARFKARHGKGGKPIGVWSGKWLAALRRATVIWEK
jgi:hypothetical protein